MKHRRYVLVGVFTAALILVGGVFTLLDAQADGKLSPVQSNKISPLLPEEDLAVTRVDILTATNTRLDFRFVAKNEGPTTISMISITYGTIVSNDTTYGNTGDKPTGGWSMISHVPELGPGEEFTVTQTANPSNIDFFAYDYFMVRIDNNNHLTEPNEANNVNWAQLAAGPDLIVPTVNVLSINSTSVVYEFVVENIGDGGADLDGPDDGNVFDNILYQAYLSENATFGDGDEVPAGGGYHISPPYPSDLFPGEVFTVTYSGSGSNFLDYRYIFVLADAAVPDALPETDETNNRGRGVIPYFLFLPVIQR